MAHHNYHNAHENKRLVSPRTSKLMWCQLVSEAHYSLPFSERKTHRKRQRKETKRPKKEKKTKYSQNNTL